MRNEFSNKTMKAIKARAAKKILNRAHCGAVYFGGRLYGDVHVVGKTVITVTDGGEKVLGHLRECSLARWHTFEKTFPVAYRKRGIGNYQPIN